MGLGLRLRLGLGLGLRLGLANGLVPAQRGGGEVEERLRMRRPAEAGGRAVRARLLDHPTQQLEHELA